MQCDVNTQFDKYKSIVDNLTFKYKNLDVYEDMKQSCYEELIKSLKAFDKSKTNSKVKDPLKCYCYMRIKTAIITATKKNRTMPLNSNNFMLRKIALECKYDFLQKHGREPLMFEVVNEVKKIVKEKYVGSKLGTINECRLSDVIERACLPGRFCEDPTSSFDNQEKHSYSMIKNQMEDRLNNFGRPRYIDQESEIFVNDVIRNLKDEDLKILRMLIAGMDQRDIAKELGVSQQKISVRKRKIINDIKEAYN
jgi:RNA polymerase sigma factor (sigma-70 family)